MYLLYTYIYISVHCQSWPRSMLQQMPQLPARGCSWNNSADQNFATIFASQRPPIWTWTCLEFLFRSSSRWTLHSTLELVILPREHWFRNTETAMGNQRPIGKFLRCKSNEVLKLCGASAKEQMVVEMTLTWKNPCKAHEMNQWIKDSTNQWIRDQWINKSMKQWITETMNQWLNNSMKQQVNESTAQRLNESVKQRISESMNQWLNDPMSQSINESANQWSTANHWIKEPISQWVHDSNIQWTNESSMIQCFHESVHQWINEPWVNGSAIQWVNESVSQRINESMGEWMSEWVNEWMNEWKNERMKEGRNEGRNEWMNESMSHWINEPRNPWIHASIDFANLILQKCSDPFRFLRFWTGYCLAQILPASSSKSGPTPSVFAILKCKANSLKCKSSSRDGLEHILPTSFSKSAPDFLNCKSSSRYSLVHILKILSSKSPLNLSFFLHFEVPVSSRYSPVHFYRFLSTSPETAETETLLRRPRKPLYPKKRRVSRPTVFSPVNSHAAEPLHFPTAWWWVVDMMMWLTWWWEC